MAEFYTILNVVRAVGTRTHRALSKTRHRFKQYVAGQRLVRNRKITLTPEKFAADRDKIQGLVLAGVVAVITPENLRVTSTADGRYILTKMATGATKVLEVGETPGCFSTTSGSPTKAELTSAPATPEAPAEREPDDLTALPSVGGGRARKLVAAGINDFQQVVDAGTQKLVEVLGVSEEVAEEIVAAATEMKE